MNNKTAYEMLVVIGAVWTIGLVFWGLYYFINFYYGAGYGY